MLATIIIFIAATLTAIFVLVNKMGQINGSRWYIKLHSHEFERRVINWLLSVWDVLKNALAHFVKILTAKVLDKLEKVFMRIFFKLFRYIHKLSDMVKGRDVPKNSGSASFFLKRIDK